MNPEFLPKLAHWAAALPVAAVSTAVLYLAALYLLFAPGHRRRLLGLYVTPVPSTHAYSGALDGYRGLAAAMVAFAHIVFFCYPVFWDSKDCYPYLISYGGNKAVPVFVMLSGFLIYRSVRKVGTAADLRDYARRRFLRIYPLYFVTTVALFAVGQVTCKPRTVVPELLMLRTLGYPTYGNPPTWSLYVEVIFYVFLPVFAVATGRRAGWAALVGFVGLTVSDPTGPRELWVWKYFCLGILASEAADWLAGRRWPGWCREAAGAALFAAGLGLLYHDLGGKDADWFSRWTGVPHNLAEYTIGLGVGFGLVVVGTMCSRAVSTAAGVWPLRFLGTISYSVFLVHPFYILANFPQMKFPQVGGVQPFFQEFGTAPWWYGFFVFSPGLVLWAAVTYAVVERPFLMMRPGKPADQGKGAEPVAPAEPLRLAA